jgi:hypothetical protein
MHPLMLPETRLALPAAFAGCVPAPRSRNVVTIIAGWVHCLGRRPVTAVVGAAGAAGTRHSSVYQRCFARAPWGRDELGRILVGLTRAWRSSVPPLVVIIDDTLWRKGGTGIGGATMQHAPLRAARRTPGFSFGHGGGLPGAVGQRRADAAGAERERARLPRPASGRSGLQDRWDHGRRQHRRNVRAALDAGGHRP